jgi:hypothetical protein
MSRDSNAARSASVSSYAEASKSSRPSAVVLVTSPARTQS